jgi:hypothetical protein
MTASTVALILLVVLLVALLPAWPYSVGFGYWPSGFVTLLVVVLLVLILLGRI